MTDKIPLLDSTPEQLPVPSQISEGSTEILRLWTSHDATTAVSIRPFPFSDETQTRAPDPAIWGVMLADVAFHVAGAFAENVVGITADEVLRRIRHGFDDIMNNPEQRGGNIERRPITKE